MREYWRDKKDYEGLYQVSNLGRILSLDYRHTGKPKLRKPVEDRCGYLQVQLWKNGKKKWFKVHRLVAETFLPNSENLPQVNHKIEGEEGKKTNIVYLNEDGSVDEEKSTIEWSTAKENCNYGTRNERSAKARINGKCSKRVLQLSLTGELIREWPSTHECERNGFDHSNVVSCCRGKKSQYKGFIWKYKED